MTDVMGDYKTLNDSGNPGFVNRLMVGTPTTGNIRIEWHQARNGQLIPVNWSWVQYYHYLNGYIPVRYMVDDAQNLIVREALRMNFEWLLFWEHDVVPPADALIRLNQYIIHKKAPIVSGIYHTRSRPSEPLVFKGRGNGSFYDWKRGDLIYCDGVPTGFLLVHLPVLKLMWDDCPEYTIQSGHGPEVTRKVFYTPRDQWNDPEQGIWNTSSGTSDLDWCTKLIEGNYIQKTGLWDKYLENLEDPKQQLIVDTNIWCGHVNPDGEMFP